ncbi:unnamed protein product [Microthlaspi erraticum]|uniref:Uncharacterized protein n=1 Tax=Microthlaspi erraticum TaxID=1685480 RepID=A0A6D2L849_9BRAS|nr:unnamed protein product [Microthlaspi erraticum]
MDGYGNGDLSKEIRGDQWKRSLQGDNVKTKGGECDTPYQDLKHPKGRDGKINTLGLEDKDVGSNPEITTKTWIKTGSRTIEQN